jgi:lipid II:glycine glycyltransferase (peptidoglycan interpeptide bridge formation enzyme)
VELWRVPAKPDPPGGSDEVAVVSADPQAPAGWDARTVDIPGGHVLQGSAWAEHRRSQGWTPHFLSLADGSAALVLTHPQRPLGGSVAYAPRGPVSGGAAAEEVARRAAGIARWARDQGAMILAVDPELDADEGYERAMRRSGFTRAEEIQPSRNRMVLRLPAADDAEGEELLRRGLTKSTRQRIRAAEEADLVVEEDPAGDALPSLGELLDAAADRRHFDFRAERGFVDWWRRVLGAGQARFFVARHEGAVVAALLAYLQGGRMATAFSADRVAAREHLPGLMHLLRWHAIQEAWHAGYPAIDLGGVDVKGHRARPAEGDPTWGLYQHKASFGAEWVESAPAHEILLRPWRYRVGLMLRSVRRVVRRSGA